MKFALVLRGLSQTLSNNLILDFTYPSKAPFIVPGMQQDGDCNSCVTLLSKDQPHDQLGTA